LPKSRSAHRLSPEDRHREILALLRREGAVQVAVLARTFNVTTETARRDLDELAENGALKRTYGGGASLSLIDEPGIGIRSRAYAAERQRIAAAAAALVEAGDALMIDCGSTTGFFAHALAARNLHLTVLTNCLPVAMAMGTSSKCRVIICPGGYVEREGGIYGADTVEFIQRYHADKAFIGAGGLGPVGVTDADSLGCAIKRAMIERSDQTVLLADSSKFNLSQFERVCGLDSLDALVCDASPPKELAGSLRKADVRVTVAPKS
jgi:DeoR/GlpR family transcriptional regulator of sugar metabolism